MFVPHSQQPNGLVARSNSSSHFVSGSSRLDVAVIAVFLLCVLCALFDLMMIEAEPIVCAISCCCASLALVMMEWDSEFCRVWCASCCFCACSLL